MMQIQPGYQRMLLTLSSYLTVLQNQALCTGTGCWPSGTAGSSRTQLPGLEQALVYRSCSHRHTTGIPWPRTQPPGLAPAPACRSDRRRYTTGIPGPRNQPPGLVPALAGRRHQ
jgi:hypothetical protein